MSIERFDSIGLNAMYETNDGDYVYQADYQELAEHVKELEIQNALYAQLQESESNLKSQWMYYQDLLSLNGFDGITDCIAKNNALKKDLRTKEPMRAVTKIIMEDNDRLKDENTQLQADLSTELKRVSSYKTLVESLESQLSHYHGKDYKLSERRLDGLEQSLISEQQMNEILTDENAWLKLNNAKLCEALNYYSDAISIDDSQCECGRGTNTLDDGYKARETLATTSPEKVTHNKPDDYNMVLRREDGLHITLDIANLTITKSGVKQFTLVMGETK